MPGCCSADAPTGDVGRARIAGVRAVAGAGPHRVSDRQTRLTRMANALRLGPAARTGSHGAWIVSRQASAPAARSRRLPGSLSRSFSVGHRTRVVPLGRAAGTAAERASPTFGLSSLTGLMSDRARYRMAAGFRLRVRRNFFREIPFAANLRDSLLLLIFR